MKRIALAAAAALGGLALAGTAQAGAIWSEYFDTPGSPIYYPFVQIDLSQDSGRYAFLTSGGTIQSISWFAQENYTFFWWVPDGSGNYYLEGDDTGKDTGSNQTNPGPISYFSFTGLPTFEDCLNIPAAYSENPCGLEAGGFYGLGYFEVSARVYSDTPFTAYLFELVPEPQAWAMMLAGFGAVGGLLRRGRRRAVLAV